MMKTAPLMDEVRVEMLQKATRDALEARFADGVPAAVVERINGETDLKKLDRWHKLAVTATLEAFQAGMD